MLRGYGLNRFDLCQYNIIVCCTKGLVVVQETHIGGGICNNNNNSYIPRQNNNILQCYYYDLVDFLRREVFIILYTRVLLFENTTGPVSTGKRIYDVYPV